MYVWAIWSVSNFDNLRSLPKEGTTSRNFSKASFKLFIRRRSRALAAVRLFFITSTGGGVVDPFPLQLPTDRLIRGWLWLSIFFFAFFFRFGFCPAVSILIELSCSTAFISPGGGRGGFQDSWSDRVVGNCWTEHLVSNRSS